MASITGIEKLFTPQGELDGFAVTTTIRQPNQELRTVSFRRSALPGNIRNSSAANITAYVNNFIRDILAAEGVQDELFVEIHVYSTSPFQAEVIYQPTPLDPNWWVGLNE